MQARSPDIDFRRRHAWETRNKHLEGRGPAPESLFRIFHRVSFPETPGFTPHWVETDGTGTIMTSARREGRVCVVGSANLDTVVRVQRHPRPGETVVASSRLRTAGGKGLNQAIAAARLGAVVRMLARVGQDADGEALRAVLAEDAIDVSGVRSVGAPTGTADIAVDDAGENTIVIFPGANGAFVALDDGDEQALAASDVVLLQGEIPLAAVEAAARLGRSAGALVVLTPAPVQSFPAGLLDQVDVLVPNEHECVQLAGIPDPIDAALALSTARRTVVVTLGSRGCAVARDGRLLLRAPAVPTTAVDTTGAGDTFVGVLGAELAVGSDIEQAVRTASAAAALSVGRPGASASMPLRKEVEALLLRLA